jgi:hypothetical protein
LTIRCAGDAAPNTRSGEGDGEIVTVKEKVGRRRYVVFRVGADVTKEGLIASLRRISGDPPYVIQCDGGYAVVRCGHDRVDITKDVVERADTSAAPVSTSGTLAALRRRYPVLKKPRPRK